MAGFDASLSQIGQKMELWGERRKFVIIGGCGEERARLGEQIREIERQIREGMEELDGQGPSTSKPSEQRRMEPGYDVETAAELLSSIYPGEEPSEVIRRHLGGGVDLEQNDDFGDLDSEFGGGGEEEGARMKSFLFKLAECIEKNDQQN